MDVQTLPQWASIERQLTKLEEASADATVDDFDREEFQEELTELDRMFENARYRVRPADQGGYRPTPLMREGTPARVLYDTFLTGYERRYEAVLDSAAAFGGGAFICTAPARPLERLTGARRHYETALESLAIKLPKARIDELWTASELLSYRYDKLLADTQTGDALDQLGLQEQALRAMAAQAQSTSAKSPDASAIGTAVQAIHDAIARRQEELGIPLRSEIEAFANRIGAAENQAIAIALGGPIEGQISDLQREALKSDELEDVAGRIHTPRSQLARVVEERRGRAAGRFALYTPRDAAHQPEFAVLAYTGESNDEDSVGCGGHYSLWKMVAINDEAVSLFGSEPRMAKPWDLTPITAAEILARAKPPQAR